MTDEHIHEWVYKPPMGEYRCRCGAHGSRVNDPSPFEIMAVQMGETFARERVSRTTWGYRIEPFDPVLRRAMRPRYAQSRGNW